MVEITKEDVLDWYQGLNASHRVEVVCALLDHSLPFELRFLGSVIENFGRKDFHILREAENKANSLHTSTETSPDVAAILKMLSEGPSPAPAPPAAPPTPSAPSGGGGGRILEEKSQTTQPELSNHADVNTNSSSDPEENGSRKDLWLNDGVKRRKFILYLSLMSATNHDSANLYYLLLSDVEDLLENLGWLEDVEESVQEEILLLYTIGSHHPAFNFEQRTFLASVITRFKDCMVRYSREVDPTFPHPNNPYNNHINQHYIPQPVLNLRKSSPNTMVLPPQHHLMQQFLGVGLPPPPSIGGQQQIQPPSVHSVPGAATHYVVINSSTTPGIYGGHPSTQQQPPRSRELPPPQHHLMQQFLGVGVPPPPPQGVAGGQQIQSPSVHSVPSSATHYVINSSTTIPGMYGGGGGHPSTQQPPRSRSFTGYTTLPAGGGDFPSQNAVENALVPGLDDPIDVSCRPRKISCYNCGSSKHLGPECKELSMEEMTKMQYRLNYGGDTNNGE